jgi:hypothetical protein
VSLADIFFTFVPSIAASMSIWACFGLSYP